MTRILIDIGLVMVALGMGYWMGFKACFDYLMEEVKERKNELYKRNNMGNDRRVG